MKPIDAHLVRTCTDLLAGRHIELQVACLDEIEVGDFKDVVNVALQTLAKHEPTLRTVYTKRGLAQQVSDGAARTIHNRRFRVTLQISSRRGSLNMLATQSVFRKIASAILDAIEADCP